MVTQLFCPLVKGPCREGACLFWLPAGSDAGCLIATLIQPLVTGDDQSSRFISLVARQLVAADPPLSATVFAILPQTLQGEVLFWLLTVGWEDHRSPDQDRLHAELGAMFPGDDPETRSARIRDHLHGRLYDIVGDLSASRRERLLDDLTARDSRVREAVGREGWLRFEDLLACGEREFQSLLRRIDNDTLLHAIKGAALPVRELFFGNLSHQAALLLREELELMGPLFVDEVLAAQRTILHALMDVREHRP